MKQKGLLNQFNTKETVIIVSSYPPKGGESARLNAVANYTRELSQSLKKLAPVVVISEILTKPQAYVEDGILVVRCFRKNDPLLTKSILSVVRQFHRVETVLVQFEFNIFGGVLATASTSALFALLKLMGKKTTFVFHQVVEDLSELSGHLGLSPQNLKTWFLSQGMTWFYRTVSRFADGIIVHDDFLKSRLSKYVSAHKIQVVPHGVSFTKSRVSREKARRILGIKPNELVLLLFGYVTWYKGSDWLTRKVLTYAENYPDKHIRLILAGGPSATLRNKPHYQAYYRSIEKLVDKHPEILTLTGYVPDRKKNLYLKACDIAVLPYRIAMSASGILSQVFAHGKPFLVSDAHFGSLTSGDISKVLNDLEISVRDITFFLANGSFDYKLDRLITDSDLRERISQASAKIGKTRNWHHTAKLYIKVLHKGYIRRAKRLATHEFRLSELSVFFPLYNEEKNIVSLVRQALVILPQIAEKFEILLINDGSTDGTGKLAQELSQKYLSVRVIHQKNLGYGGAVKTGLRSVRYEWVFFSDADLQFDLEELGQFIPYTQLHDLVIGYRKQRAEGMYRAMIAGLLKIWNKLFLDFPMPIKDVDCAYKLMSKRVVEAISPLYSNGAMVSTEMLLKAYQAGFSFTQIGVSHYPRLAGKSTGSNIRVILKAVRDTFVLRKLLRTRSAGQISGRLQPALNAVH